MRRGTCTLVCSAFGEALLGEWTGVRTNGCVCVAMPHARFRAGGIRRGGELCGVLLGSLVLSDGTSYSMVHGGFGLVQNQKVTSLMVVADVQRKCADRGEASREDAPETTSGDYFCQHLSQHF